jgi:hypothetical protein
MDPDALKLRYDEMRTEAMRRAGDLVDIPRRVMVRYNHHQPLNVRLSHDHLYAVSSDRADRMLRVAQSV